MQPQDLVSGAVRIVSLPEVCLRISEMLDDPRVSAADLGKVISQDTGLTARLLKIVNSAFYGFPSRIETVTRAVTVIGLRELRSMVLAASVVEAFSTLPTKVLDIVAFWRHSVYCGVVAQLLAEQCHVLHRERLFVAGLLHDIGKLLIVNRVPEKAEEINRLVLEEGLLQYQAERQVLGFDHAEVGGALLDSWKMPETLRQAVRWHHEPANATEATLEAALIHIANIMSDMAEQEIDSERSVQPVDAAAWRISGLDQSVMEPVFQDAGPQFTEALELILPRGRH